MQDTSVELHIAMCVLEGTILRIDNSRQSRFGSGHAYP